MLDSLPNSGVSSSAGGPEHEGSPSEAPAKARLSSFPWRIGLIVESELLIGELTSALAEIGSRWEFQLSASTPPFEAASMVERQRPDVVFVELSAVSGSPGDWLNIVRAGNDLPIVVAIHTNSDPAGMIVAMRAGAGEFLSSPVNPAIYEILDRVATQLESRQITNSEPGKFLGVLSAKGGCGGTTFACHLALAIQLLCGKDKVLFADLDHQAPAAHKVFRVPSPDVESDAFNSVRRLNSSSWPEFVTPINAQTDLMHARIKDGPPEPWRIDNLFRFVKRQYAWTVVDLGRHLNPSNFAFLPSVEQLLVVTAPDVLALYQTRGLLQTLANRGYDKSKIRLILNRNENAPQDFWAESIEQMFDIKISVVLPFDRAGLGSRDQGTIDLPASSSYGRAVSRMAGIITGSGGPGAPSPSSSLLSFMKRRAA